MSILVQVTLPPPTATSWSFVSLLSNSPGRKATLPWRPACSASVGTEHRKKGGSRRGWARPSDISPWRAPWGRGGAQSCRSRKLKSWGMQVNNWRYSNCTHNRAAALHLAAAKTLSVRYLWFCIWKALKFLQTMMSACFHASSWFAEIRSILLVLLLTYADYKTY